MTENAVQRCEYEDCQLPADGWVEAQSRISDFVRYEGCREHLELMAWSLSLGTVEHERCWLDIKWYYNAGV